jgi:hypothetical protein
MEVFFVTPLRSISVLAAPELFRQQLQMLGRSGGMSGWRTIL